MLLISPDNRRAVTTINDANTPETFTRLTDGRKHTAVITKGADADAARVWAVKTRAEAREVARTYKAQGFTVEYFPPKN